MRNAFVKALSDHLGRSGGYFLTGDLGFAALEPLRDVLGSRFINVGIAEQNMIGVAAGMAREGLEVWAYSIAPFCYARPFEQIRNDLCLNRLPVRLVGNGGGYAYGVMGPTHHALEDYGALLGLQGLSAYVPVRADDLGPVIQLMAADDKPAYLRLGRDESAGASAWPTFAPWRQVAGVAAAKAVVVACGPIADSVRKALEGVDPAPDLWTLGVLGDEEVPAAVLDRIAAGAALMTVEEHVAQGGIGMRLVHALCSRGIAPRRFKAATAAGYPSGLYGSQAFHRQESALDPEALRSLYQELVQ